MPHIQQFFATGSGGQNSITVPITAPVSVGHLLVIGLYTRTGGGAPYTATDTKNNAYYLDRLIPAGSGSDQVAMLRCKVGYSLSVGDSITITWDAAASRVACAVEHFNDEIYSVGNFSSNNNGEQNSPDVTTDPIVADVAPSIAVGVIGLMNTERDFTPNLGWTAGNKIASQNGTGDRAVFLIWRNETQLTTLTPGGTLNIGATWTIAAGVYGKDPAGGPGGAGGTTKVWSGSAWVDCPVRVWSGSAWVETPVKVWSGSAWVEAG